MAKRGEREAKGGDRGNQHKEAKSQRATLPKLCDIGVTRTQSSRWQKLAALPREEQEAKICHAMYKAEQAIEGNKPRWNGNGSDEWFTPVVPCIDAARAVLGDIDTDPATCAFAQSRIKAARFYTKQDDGLAHCWHGRVWLNPPFSRVAEFVAKLVSEIKSERVTAAILLTPNCSDAGWFHEAAETAAAICFTRGRIRFENEDGPVDRPPQGQAFFYFGKKIAAFRVTFESIGLVLVPAGRLAVNMKAPVGRRGFLGSGLRLNTIIAGQSAWAVLSCQFSAGRRAGRFQAVACGRAALRSCAAVTVRHSIDTSLPTRIRACDRISPLWEECVLTNRASLFVHYAKRCTAMTPVTGA